GRIPMRRSPLIGLFGALIILAGAAPHACACSCAEAAGEGWKGSSRHGSIPEVRRQRQAWVRAPPCVTPRLGLRHGGVRSDVAKNVFFRDCTQSIQSGLTPSPRHPPATLLS